MKKQLIRISAFLSIAIGLYSCQKQTISEQTVEPTTYLVDDALALEIAKPILGEVTGNGQLQKNSKSTVSTVRDDQGLPYMHVVSAANHKDAFVIIAGDQRISPVLAYGDTGFDLNDQPEQLESWMELYTRKIDQLRSENAAYDIQQSEKFMKKAIQVTQKITSEIHAKNDDVVFPVIDTRWGQGCVYNGFSPSASDVDCANSLPCGKLYTGCVATCLAQMVNYYESMEAFNYNLLFSSYTQDFIDTDEGDEVASLMRSVGEIMEMRYTCSSSLAYSNKVLNENVRTALGFDENIRVKSFRDFAVDDIIKELRTKNPIVISGKDYSNGRRVGHLWILDGYVRYPMDTRDDVVYFHFNLGWDGKHNGWYLYDDFQLGSYNLAQYLRFYYNFRN